MMERLIAATKDVVLIVEDQGDGARLVEIWADDFRSETLHSSIERARKSAEDWWRVELYWEKLPDDIRDIKAYAKKILAAVIM